MESPLILVVCFGFYPSSTYYNTIRYFTMSDIIQPEGQDESQDEENRIDRRSILKALGVGGLGGMLGAGFAGSSEVSAHPSASQGAAQMGNCGTALGTVLDPGGQAGFGNAAFNFLLPSEPQSSLSGVMMTPNGAVPTEVRLSGASVESIVNEGVPDVKEQLAAGEGFRLQMEDGKRLAAEQLVRGPGGSIQFQNVRASFADVQLNVSGFPPPDHWSVDDSGSMGDSGGGSSAGGLGTDPSAIERFHTVQGWEVAVIFGVAVVISSGLCWLTAVQAASECEEGAKVSIDWKWYGGFDCDYECKDFG